LTYTCSQRGGECCENGGTSIVDGASDCPATCFSSCNAGQAQPAQVQTGPAGAAVSVDDSVVIFGALVLIIFLLLYIAAKK
jgi:hypothetical protein